MFIQLPMSIGINDVLTSSHTFNEPTDLLLNEFILPTVQVLAEAMLSLLSVACSRHVESGCCQSMQTIICLLRCQLVTLASCERSSSSIKVKSENTVSAYKARFPQDSVPLCMINQYSVRSSKMNHLSNLLGS